MARILIATTRPVVRLGLEQIIQRTWPGTVQVLTAASSEQAVVQLETHKPILVLANPEILPGMQQRLKGACPDARILIISGSQHIGIASVREMSCVCGHLSDRASEEKLIEAIRVGLYCGHLNPTACTSLPCPLKSSLLPVPLDLSVRQQEIFDLIGEGQQPREIAQSLKISVKTVESYRVQIKQKLGLADSRSLFEFAVRWRYDSLASPNRKLG
jgi:DNA-binding NarL/FixJ family response regulator